jgi:hypothetical protein
MSSTQNKFLAQWSPLIGRDSAIGLRKYLLSMLLTIALCPIWLALLAIGQPEAVTAVGWVVAALDALSLIAMAMTLSQFRQKVSIHFGHEIPLFRLPPFRADRFEAWRTKMQF